MKRVLEVNVDDRGYGGVFAFVLNMLGSIDHQKIILDVCTFEKFDDEQHKDKFTKYGGRVYDCQGTGNFIKKQLQTCMNFYRMLKTHPYEVVHIHSDVAYKLLIYGLVAKFGGVKTVIVHSHSTGIEGRHHTIKKILQQLAKLILSHTDFVKFACSNLAAQWMYKKPEKAVIIKNGIIIEKFAFSDETRRRIRNKLGITDGCFFIGTVGRFTPQKNPFYELEIIKNIFLKDPEARFLWIGSGDLKQEIEEKAKSYDIYDRIIFLGNTDHVDEYYQAMDCFILPSKFEGLPIVGIEAQAAGLNCFFSSQITRELGITHLAHFISINVAPEQWAEEILRYKYEKRCSNQEEVSDSGYNIRKEIKKIERFYLNFDEEQ